MAEPFTITRHSTGEMLEGKAAHEFLKGLEKKPRATRPRTSPPKRRTYKTRSHTQFLAHMAFAGCVVGVWAWVMVTTN